MPLYPPATAGVSSIGPRTAFPSVAAGTMITGSVSDPTYGASIGQNIAYSSITTYSDGTKSGEYWWDFSSSGAGTDGSGIILFNLPSGQTINTTIAPPYAGVVSVSVLSYSIGGLFLATRAAGTLFIQGNPYVYSSTQIAAFYSLGFNSPNQWNSTSGFFSSGSCTMTLHFSVPLT